MCVWEWVSVLNGVWLEGSELFLQSLRVSRTQCDLNWTLHTNTHTLIYSFSALVPTVYKCPPLFPSIRGHIGYRSVVSLGFHLDSLTLLVPRLDQCHWKKLKFSPLKGWSVWRALIRLAPNRPGFRRSLVYILIKRSDHNQWMCE